MTKERKEKLLLEIAAQLDDGQTPMNHEWLVRNQITLDECGAFCDLLALIVRGYAQAPERIQLMIMACSVVDSKKLAEGVVYVMERKRIMAELAKK